TLTRNGVFVSNLYSFNIVKELNSAREISLFPKRAAKIRNFFELPNIFTTFLQAECRRNEKSPEFRGFWSGRGDFLARRLRFIIHLLSNF
ncbi:MAG: hypothetical protein K5651_01900, partial [Bacteroidales bacterium]|nr:hypothetical protein [Bacteroidales bacterium]